MNILLKNCTRLDVIAGDLKPDQSILIESGLIREIGEKINSQSARVIDVHGRVVMPGLADAHVHVTQLATDITFLNDASPSYVSAQSSVVMREMLRRGFTTVRDAGGADYGLAAAVEDGLFVGPRLLFSGHALSQTGGHGDQRSKGTNHNLFCPTCLGRPGHICDGVDAVRRAARDELRKGAHQIKIMASGGIISPTDKISNTQFSLEEIRAAVDEAEAHGTYVMAHAYTPKAISRALNSGVRSIEHGNMIDEATAALLVQKQAFLVPTMVVYWAMHREGPASGIMALFQSKVAEVHKMAMQGFETADRKGVKIAFGTDLMGVLHRHQSHEFSLRREIQKPIEIIRSATTTAAELFNMQGKIGVLAPGAHADILIVEGDPLREISVLERHEKSILAVMKGGEFCFNKLQQ